MEIDLTDMLDKAAKMMDAVGKAADSELQNIVKEGNIKDAKEAHSMSYEAASVVSQAKDQIMKVHYGAKKRQEKQQG